MDRNRGVFGEGLTRVLETMTQGSEIASQALGRDGWLHIEAETGFRDTPDAGQWFQISLDFALEAQLSREGTTGLYLHPFTLTLSSEGARVDEWSDALSNHWDGFPTETRPDHRRGQGAAILHTGGSLALLDVWAPSGAVLEVHLRLPWRDREKRQGFEADSRLDLAVLRISTLSRAARLVRTPGLEQVIVGRRDF